MISSSPDPSSGPIYVVGLDRSGKTTMAALLASHSRIAIPAVGSNMWTYFYGRYGDLTQAADLDRCLVDMSRYKHVRFLKPDVARIRAEFLAGPPTYGRLFGLFLEHFADGLDKPRWGAQSGLVEQYADLLFEAYPDLSVIHMVRDPRDRYEASLAKWPDGRGRAGGAAGRWQYSVSMAERNVEHYGDRYRVVRFEDLVIDTERLVRDLCAWLGEAYEPAMLDLGGAHAFAAKLGESATTEPDRGQRLADLLSDEFIGRHRGRVDERELGFLEQRLCGAMKRHGYNMSTPPPTGVERLRFLPTMTNQMLRMRSWQALETLHRRWPARFGHAIGRRMIIDEPLPEPLAAVDRGQP